MSKNLIHVIILIFLSCTSFSQSLTSKEGNDLEILLYNYLDGHMPKAESETAVKGRSSEAFFCLLDIDSSGKVASVNLLADDKNKNVCYGILSKMTPDNFNNWNCEKCMGKTIMIFISLMGGGDKPKYVGNLIWGVGNAIKPTEANNLIILRGMSFNWPTYVN